MTLNSKAKQFTILPVLLALMLVYAATAQADLKVREEVHELNTKQILRWPLREGDSLVFRPCLACDIETLKATESTRFANGFGTSTITLDEVLRQKTLLRDGTEHVVVIFYLPDDRHITRLILQTEF